MTERDIDIPIIGTDPLHHALKFLDCTETADADHIACAKIVLQPQLEDGFCGIFGLGIVHPTVKDNLVDAIQFLETNQHLGNHLLFSLEFPAVLNIVAESSLGDGTTERVRVLDEVGHGLLPLLGLHGRGFLAQFRQHAIMDHDIEV